jgi:hypothetical protein
MSIISTTLTFISIFDIPYTKTDILKRTARGILHTRLILNGSSVSEKNKSQYLPICSYVKLSCDCDYLSKGIPV